MSIKQFYNILAILLGYGLIIGSFIIFGESLEDRVKILDIIASCFIFTQFVQFMLFPLINLSKPAHKEVGMMGIHFTVINICCILSLALMVCGIVYQISFKIQLIGQLAILFFLLLGRVIILHSGEKIEQIHGKEQHIMHRKMSLRYAMDNFMDESTRVIDLDESDRKRLANIHESMRFITPSANPEAIRFDNQFIQTLEDLTVLMRNVTFNKTKITEQINQLERILSRRKNINT